MKVVFVSNYINHHQIPFCNAMHAKLGEDFYFVQTQPMEEERIRMGWGKDYSVLPYLHCYYEEEDFCKELIAESDVVLFGGVDDESYIEKRLEAGKLVVRLSERIYKSGRYKAISPRGLQKKYHDHIRYRKAPVYLLCCGGYVAGDFGLIHAYPDKMFKWGYFPAFVEQDVETLLEKKKSLAMKDGKTRLLWAGRFIDWKHPEFAIRAARRLKQEGYSFTLTMVGGGDMEPVLKDMVKEWDLSEEVLFAGFQPPEKVRTYMEEAQIYLFTSDYLEGWGAVLNESMNSACAVVADSGIGAVPHLAKHGENMLVYPAKNFNEFYYQLTNLIQKEDMMCQLGKNAYATIRDEWNGEVAAGRLLPFLEGLCKGEVKPYEEGILSPAKPMPVRKVYSDIVTQKGNEK